MFYYLEGKVAHVEPYLAVIDCGGVATPAAQRTTPSVSSRRVKSNGFTPT